MLVVQSLTQELFKPYGDVIDVNKGSGVAANQGILCLIRNCKKTEYVDKTC